MNELILKIALSGAGVSFILYAVRKVWKEEAWKKMWRNLGRRMSGKARGRLGKAFWEPIETFLQSRLNVAVVELSAGLDEDDNSKSET